MKVWLSFWAVFLLYTIWALPTVNTKNVNSAKGNVNVPYTLWIGSNVTTIHEIHVSVPTNTTFYNVMLIAAQEDSRYNFSATAVPGYGRYITSMSGYEEDPVNNIYWMMYNLTNNPHQSEKPTNTDLSPLGIDVLIVEHGQHYLFWYQYFANP